MYPKLELSKQLQLVGNLLEGDNVYLKCRTIPILLITDITLFVYVCSHKGPAYSPECNEM